MPKTIEYKEALLELRGVEILADLLDKHLSAEQYAAAATVSQRLLQELDGCKARLYSYEQEALAEEAKANESVPNPEASTSTPA